MHHFLKRTLCSLGALFFAGATSIAVAGPLESLLPGEWYEVPGSSISGVNPCPANNCSYSGSVGQRAVVETWNGAALATKYGTKGGLALFGGGHNGYLGNEMYVFDIGRLQWVRATDPVANPTCDHAEAELQDGSPCAPHTYDYVSYHPGSNSFVKLGSASDHEAGGTGSPRVHMFSFDNNKWRRGTSRPKPDGTGLAGGAEGASSAYDASRDVFWSLFSFNDGFAKFDPNANAGSGQWTTYGNYFIVIDAVAAIDPVHDLYVAIEGRQTHSMVVFDLKDPSAGGTTVTTAGDTSAMQTKLVGFDWDPTSQAFIAWIGGTDIYKLTPPSGNWKTAAWQWSKIPAAASNRVTPTAPNQYGTYGRWRYVPSVNAFMVVNSTSENVFFYKLSNAAPIVSPTISFTSDSLLLGLGLTTTLRWSATNADSCTAGGGWAGTKATSGTQLIGPLSLISSFTLTCSNSAGGISTKAVSVDVSTTPPPTTPAPTVSLSANPTTVASGGSSSLTWTSTNATGCAASTGDASWSGAKAVNGSGNVGPISSTTTYVISCTGAGGTTTASATVSLSAVAAPTITITASPISIQSGDSTTISWNALNATSCTASGGWSGAKAVSGSQQFTSLTTSQIYTLSCSGSVSSTTQQITVTVGTTAPPATAAATVAERSGGGAMGVWAIMAMTILFAIRTFARQLKSLGSLRVLRMLFASLILATVAAKAIAAVDITTVTVTSEASATQTNVPVTFGQIFKPGDVASASALSATQAGGASIPIQVDPKATHPDGSLRHAIITLKVPSLAAGASTGVVLSAGASGSSSGSSVTLLQLLNTSFDAQVSLNVAGTTYTASAKTLLGGTTQQWLNGPLASEWIVSGPVKTSAGASHPHLTAYFHVRAYSDGAGGVGTVRVDCIVENGWTLVAAPSTLAYDATITVGGASVYTNSFTTTDATKPPHYDHARWHKQFWWPSAPQAYAKVDTTYLRATKAVPNIGNTVVANTYLNALKQSATPMKNGDLTQYMPSTGAQDQIGPLPRYEAVFLASNADVRSLRNVLSNNDSAGSYSVHYRDEATGRPVSIGDRPTLSLQTTSAWPTVTGGPNPNEADSAHQPSLGFLAYAITGDYYYMEEMQFWTSWNQLWLEATGRQNEKGIVGSQNRTQAWMMRNLGQAAYLTPDTHAYKAHLKANVDDNYARYDQLYTNNSSANNLGAVASYNGYTIFALWQDDWITWTAAYLNDLGFTSAVPFRNWKFKMPVGRMNTTGYCFRNYSNYIVQSGTSDSAFYPDFKALYDANLAAGKFTAVSSCNLGDAIIDGYPRSADGYIANSTPALAAAVEAGYPGASAAWARLKGSSVVPDFDDVTGLSGCSTQPCANPTWNVVPRTDPLSNAPSVTLSAAPTAITTGGNTTLTWTSTNATSCAATGGWSGAKATSGSQTITSIAATTTFTLACSGSGGPTATQSIQVTTSSGTTTPPPVPPSTPTASIAASSSTVVSGGSITLTWTSTVATSCTASGAWSGTKATIGSEVIANVTQTGTYTLACGTASQSVAVTVTTAPPPPPPAPPATGSASASESSGGGAFGFETLLLTLLGLIANRRRFASQKN